MLHVVAEHVHKVWCGWMAYIFSCGKFDEAGNLVLPACHVERWTRQCQTHYRDLPEHETASDKEIAREFLGIMVTRYRVLFSLSLFVLVILFALGSCQDQVLSTLRL